MKTGIYLIATFIALIKAIIASSDVNSILDAMMDKPKKDIFKVFHYLHKKDYKLESEEGLKRYQIFKENLKWAKAKNAELGSEVYGITKFMDLTNEEFRANYLMKTEVLQQYISSMKSFASSKSFLNEESKGKINFDALADLEDNEEGLNASTSNSQNNTKIDWTPFLNKPKDQGNCGSCWAFSAIATIEGQFNSKFGKLYDFSEQHLVDCDNFDNGCNGGWPSNTYEWLSKNGVVLQTDSPYQAKKGICEAAKLSPREFKIVKGYEMYQKGPSSPEKWFELLRKGPILVAMDANDIGFSLYRPSANQPWVPASCGQLSHAVVAIGYEIVNGTEYLTVRNSWGTDWGINGNFRVEANNHCGILDYAWLPDIINQPAPNPNPDPNPNPNPNPQPEPTPVNPDEIPFDCAKVYPKCGFSGEPKIFCDSVTSFNSTVSGIKLSHNRTNIDEIVLFKKPNCMGEARRLYDEMSCIVDVNHVIFSPKSLALNRVNKRGCISFYSNFCFQGISYIDVCGSVNDIQAGTLGVIKSIDFDTDGLYFVTFYEQPNYLGKAYSVSARDLIYNINTNRELLAALKKTRSIYLGVSYEA